MRRIVGRAGVMAVYSKPEYAVVWAGKNNSGDMNGNYVLRFINQGQLSPASLREVAPLQLLPAWTP